MVFISSASVTSGCSCFNFSAVLITSRTFSSAIALDLTKLLTLSTPDISFSDTLVSICLTASVEIFSFAETWSITLFSSSLILVLFTSSEVLTIVLTFSSLTPVVLATSLTFEASDNSDSLIFDKTSLVLTSLVWVAAETWLTTLFSSSLILVLFTSSEVLTIVLTFSSLTPVVLATSLTFEASDNSDSLIFDKTSLVLTSLVWVAAETWLTTLFSS